VDVTNVKHVKNKGYGLSKKDTSKGQVIGTGGFMLRLERHGV
jgi:hypothetical protein